MNPDMAEHMINEDEATLNKDTVQIERMNAQIEQLLAENAALRKVADLKKTLTDDETTIEMGEKELERMIAQLPKKPTSDERIVSDLPGGNVGIVLPQKCVPIPSGGEVKMLVAMTPVEAEALEYQLRQARLKRTGQV